MALPAGYSYEDEGWIYKSDGTGPYSVSSGGVATLLGGTLVTADPTGFSKGQDGLWYYTDGSGPYVKGTDGMYKFLN